MLDIDNLLDIKYFNGSTYSDLKIKLGSPGKDTESITLADSDYIYIGFYKSLRNYYFDFTTPNTNTNSLVLEYYNGTAWTEVNDKYDETEGFTRSGAIQFSELTDQSEIEIDSVTKYWIRIQPTATHTVAAYNFIGLIFATDDDLTLENPFILDEHLLMGESSHLKAHVAARNEIIQTYSNKGNYKLDSSLKKTKITFWDMLDIREFRQGSIFLALSKIYFNLSDRPEDTFLKKSKDYYNKYQRQINLYFTTVDLNDNGTIDSSERLNRVVSKTITR